MDLSEASKYEILEKLASDASCADHKDPGLVNGVSSGLIFHEAQTSP